ncbi:biliverdin-producing heme oxygenase [Flavisolibacter tropicus]|uniref:biliverdin-producing heme oxygenase n=1 Tax=Flavisolibacter tropicus TaxID=1492898 RepID=UPI000836639D|nr:biliverdin-producing heme oxygenase [Flavisolibacter tropicus]
MFASETLTPLAQHVKKQTNAEHMALEDLIVPQIQSVQSVNDYAQLLSLFYGYNKPVEQAIHAIIDASVLPDIAKRHKAHLLVDDLKALGFSQTPKLCDNIPSIQSLEEAFGALYVLEGSTLGGKSITQLLLKTRLDLQPSHLRFFNAYGKETGPMWMAFLSQLNTFTSEAQQAMIIDAARETFIKFKQWILQVRQS